MSKKKGVSASEKRTRMLELFYEKKSFFQLKDLEKIAPKEKGIIANSVKEVIQKLVDEGLVETDKVGTSIYFWAFPSKAKDTRKRKLEEITTEYQQSSKRFKETTENIEKLKVGREESNEKKAILDKIGDLHLERDELQKQLSEFKENDPEVYEKTKKRNEEIKDAANRWTDNIFSIKTWCKNKFMMEDNVLDKQFGIPENFDYID